MIQALRRHLKANQPAAGSRSTAGRRHDQAGFLTPALLVVIIAFAIIAAAAGQMVYQNFFIAGNNSKSQQALNIAEAGVNYYLWHLNHNGADYKDGTGSGTLGTYGYGPYVHTYINANAVATGTFTLYIKPPVVGSAVTVVRSIGKASGSNITRTVEAQIGSTSFANYAVLSDSALWFGADETANGPVHSNQGVRMDGPNTDEVTSANSTYYPSYQVGGSNWGNVAYPGVWCSTSVTTPVNCTTRSKASWNFPVTSIDFNQISGSLCQMKKDAFSSSSSTSSYSTQSNACSLTPTTLTPGYLPRRSSKYSISRGYLIQLNSNGTYTLYDVNGENDQLTPYTSALSLSLVASSVTIPTNGVIFAEDNVWVRTNGNFNGRVTIGAGRLADSNNANITIADDVTYAAKDGSDVIGLVAEGSVDIAPYAPPNTSSFTYEVDAAIIAQSGSVEYEGTYRTNPYRCTRGWVSPNQQFLFYGSVATRQTWTWNWQGGYCGDAVYDPVSGYYISGIEHTTTSYDYNLLGAQPPDFPVTSGYSILAWREVLTHP